MKLKLLTLAAILLSLAPAAAPAQVVSPALTADGTGADYRPDRAALLLRGPVRSVEEEGFNLYATGEKAFTGNITYRFDTRGRLVQLLRGNLQLDDVYDDRYSYRADGRLAGVERLFGGKVPSRDVFVYDDARRRVEILTYSPRGALGMRVSKAYDERGGVTRSEIKFLATAGPPSAGGPAVEMSHTYDERGRAVTSAVKDSAGRTLTLVTRRREADGRLVSTMKDLREAARATMATTVTTQDARGDVLSTETYSADGTLTARITYARKFDARGNWVEEVIRTWERREGGADESSFLRRRTITYY